MCQPNLHIAHETCLQNGNGTHVIINVKKGNVILTMRTCLTWELLQVEPIGLANQVDNSTIKSVTMESS